MTRLLRDEGGTVAIEAAIVFPILALFLAGVLALVQMASLQEGCRYTSASAALAGALACGPPGTACDTTAAGNAASAVIQANTASFFPASATVTPTITFGNGVNISVSIAAQVPALLPFFGSTISANAAASD